MDLLIKIDVLTILHLYIKNRRFHLFKSSVCPPTALESFLSVARAQSSLISTRSQRAHRGPSPSRTAWRAGVCVCKGMEMPVFILFPALLRNCFIVRNFQFFRCFIKLPANNVLPPFSRSHTLLSFSGLWPGCTSSAAEMLAGAPVWPSPLIAVPELPYEAGSGVR